MMLVFERVLFPWVRFLPAFAPFHDVQPMTGRQKHPAPESRPRELRDIPRRIRLTIEIGRLGSIGPINRDRIPGDREIADLRIVTAVKQQQRILLARSEDVDTLNRSRSEIPQNPRGQYDHTGKHSHPDILTAAAKDST